MSSELDGIMEAGGYELADLVQEWLEKHSGFYSASRIARGIKANVTDVYPVLDYMVEHVYIRFSGNSHWQNYAAR